MHHKNIPCLLALVIVLFAGSCAKVGPTGPQGNPGPSYTGTVTGFVSLYDKYGSPVLTGLDNISITLTGSATVSAPVTYAYANGFYRYLNVTTGTYSLAAMDTSTSVLYGATQINNINFLAGTLNQDIKLSAIPDSFITAFASYQSNSFLGDSLVIHTTSDSRLRNCLVQVNASPTAGVYLLYYVVPVPPLATAVTLLIPRQDLLNAGLTSGEHAYYAAYSYVVNDASVYENTSNGKKVFTAVYPTPVVDSALVP